MFHEKFFPIDGINRWFLAQTFIISAAALLATLIQINHIKNLMLTWQQKFKYSNSQKHVLIFFNKQYVHYTQFTIS